MDGDDKNDEMLRETVKSIDDSPKSTFFTKKNIIIIIVLCILCAAIVTGLVLYFVLKDNEDDENAKIDVLDGLLERQFPEIKDRFEFKIEESKEPFSKYLHQVPIL